MLDGTELSKELGITRGYLRQFLDAEKIEHDDTRYWRRRRIHVRLYDPARIPELTERLAAYKAKRAAEITETRKSSAKVAAQTRKDNDEVRKLINIAEYEKFFPNARAIKRKFVLCIGPTNSGKTHAAMERLTEAKNGCYLAPLRLMALENYERLADRGVATSLLTGEERIIREDATHVSSTIEMMDEDRVYDVGVIDEAQMVEDEGRGWAWTRALFGLAAKEIFVCGSPVCKAFVEKVCEITGDEMEVRTFTRRSALEFRVGQPPISKGTAVVVFSRREVHEWRERLSNRGMPVSVIYGALSPDVRRQQSHAFRTGETHVLVATDAIGMGLNLPIENIYVPALQKFDGKAVRRLTAPELKQICGRAGRDTATGIVWTHSAVMAEVQSQDHVPVVHFKVMPPLAALKIIATRTENKAFSDALRFAIERIKSPLFSVANSDDLIKSARFIENYLGFDSTYRCLGLPWYDHNSFEVARLLDQDDKYTPSTAVPSITNNHDLRAAEDKIKILEAYRFLQHRWPERYPKDVSIAMDSINQAIINFLMKRKNEANAAKKNKKKKKKKKNRNQGMPPIAADTGIEATH